MLDINKIDLFFVFGQSHLWHENAAWYYKYVQSHLSLSCLSSKFWKPWSTNFTLGAVQRRVSMSWVKVKVIWAHMRAARCLRLKGNVVIRPPDVVVVGLILYSRYLFISFFVFFLILWQLPSALTEWNSTKLCQMLRSESVFKMRVQNLRYPFL